MNRLSNQKRAVILSCLVEGNSIRATSRMTGAAKRTVLKLLADVGAACVEYQNKTLRGLPCRHIQADEIWSFCHAKAKNVPAEKKASGATGTCGRGRRCGPTASWFRRGWSLPATGTRRPPS